MPVSTDKLCSLKSLDFFFSLLCVLQQISISVTFLDILQESGCFFCFLWSFAREISAGRPKFIHLRMLDVWLLPWFYANRKGAVPTSGGSQTWTGKTAKIESTKTQARVDSTVCCNASATLVPLMIICIITEYSGIKNDTLSQIRVNVWILLPGYPIGKILMSMVVARLAVVTAFTLIYIFTAEMFPTTLR